MSRPVFPHVEAAKKKDFDTGQSLHLLWLRAFDLDERVAAANTLIAEQTAALETQQAETTAALRRLEAPTDLAALRRTTVDDSGGDPGGGGGGGDPGTVPDLYTDIVAARAAYGATMTADECVALLNTVAFQNQSDGFGLLHKPGGNHGSQPHTGIPCSVDLIYHLPTNTLWDALFDAGHNTAGPGPSKPQWNLASTNPGDSFITPVAP